jgi:TatD DNase family protein
VELIDTHAHLDDERFAGDLGEVLARAWAAGLVRVIAVGTTAASSRACIELANREPRLSATAGIHPNHAAQEPAAAWDDVVRLAGDPRVVGLGETGLDRHWDYTPFATQEDYFARHLDLSRKTGKPVVIHCRDAEADVVRMLRADFDRHGPVRGVLHSFAGKLETAQAGLAMGLYVSFAGMLTYKNAQEVRDVARLMPQGRVLVETDCPYLAPVPLRGKRNEPAHVVHTAAVLAATLGVAPEVVAAHTTANARALFGLS